MLNAALVVVGGGGIIVALRTLTQIRRQTDATAVAANAAKESADAVTFVERGWLLTDSWEVTQPTPWPQSGPPALNSFKYSMKNFGQTPIFVVSTGSRFRLVSSLENLPNEPEYGAVLHLPFEIVIAPDKSTPAVECHVEPDGRLSSHDVEEIRGGRKMLYGYGFVTYRDVFGKIHETRFCARYHPGFLNDTYHGLRLAGPPAYNRQT